MENKTSIAIWFSAGNFPTDSKRSKVPPLRFQESSCDQLCRACPGDLDLTAVDLTRTGTPSRCLPLKIIAAGYLLGRSRSATNGSSSAAVF